MSDFAHIIKHTATISLLEYQERYQHIDKFLGYCKQCRNYGQQWVCPPFDFDVNEFLKPYHTVDIIGYQVVLTPEMAATVYPNPEARNEAVEEIMQWARAQIDPEMLALETAHPGSRACYPGSCKLCSKGACTRLIDKLVFIQIKLETHWRTLALTSEPPPRIYWGSRCYGAKGITSPPTILWLLASFASADFF